MGKWEMGHMGWENGMGKWEMGHMEWENGKWVIWDGKMGWENEKWVICPTWHFNLGHFKTGLGQNMILKL